MAPAERMREERATLAEGPLAYLRGGRGPLVVLSHGLGPVAWGLLDGLARSCTVAVPVWERSSLPAAPRIGLGWFEPLAAAMGYRQASLCAWSMAAPAAIRYASRRPPGLSHLVLLEPAGMGPDLPRLRLRDLPHVLATRVIGRPTRGFVRLLWRNWVHRKNVDTAPLEEATYRFFRSEPDAFGFGADEEEIPGTPSDLLPSIGIPTLVLAGKHSTVLGPNYARTAAARLPRGKWIVFEESGHAPQLEEPEKFQEAVAAFVNDRS